MHLITFLAILRRTSLTSIGCIFGFLLSGINGLVVRASKLLPVPEFEISMFVLHKRFLRNFLLLFKDLRDLSRMD